MNQCVCVLYECTRGTIKLMVSFKPVIFIEFCTVFQHSFSFTYKFQGSTKFAIHAWKKLFLHVFPKQISWVTQRKSNRKGPNLGDRISNPTKLPLPGNPHDLSLFNVVRIDIAICHLTICLSAWNKRSSECCALVMAPKKIGVKGMPLKSQVRELIDWVIS